MKKICVIILTLLIALNAGCSNENITDSGNGGSYTVSGKVLYESGVGIEYVLVNIFSKAGSNVTGEKVKVSVSTKQDRINNYNNI